MDIQEFWNLTDLIDRNALAEEDEELAMEKLISVLSRKTEDEIFQFDEHMSQLLYAIDGRKWADSTGEAGGSDDSFLYVRCYVVAQGQSYYEKIVRAPSEIPDSVECWAESLLYVASEAWSLSTGKEQDEYTYDASVSYESCSNDTNW